MDTSPLAAIDAARLQAWRAFLAAHARIVPALEQELRDAHDLPLTWYDVLVQLSEAPERRLRMQDLADAVVLSRSGLTRLVDRMEDAGLVTRAACDDDRRGTYAELTDEGLDTIRRCAPTHVDGVRRHFTDHLADDEVDAVRDALQRIADALR